MEYYDKELSDHIMDVLADMAIDMDDWDSNTVIPEFETLARKSTLAEEE